MHLQAISGSGLGLLRDELIKSAEFKIPLMTAQAQELALSRILIMSKGNFRSTVHRDVYNDFIGVKRFNDKGEVVGFRQIIGLYTSAAYRYQS